MGYIIYLDTKIKGALYQTIKYFTDKVFDKNTLIVFKSYKEINTLFKKEFKKYSINYLELKRYKDLPSLKNKIVFYLFNAQSNCRIVAYREAVHIFVTHGESHKLSSAKPIVRIYDYVVVAGDSGIDRFLEHGIFSNCDLKNKKIIKMGDTFIGKSQFIFENNSKTILYAPTWEGGVIEENYSSITSSLENFKFLSKYAKQNNYTSFIIQPHPNTGHRDKRYIYYLYQGIKYLKKQGYKVSLTVLETTFLQRIIFSNTIHIQRNNNYKISIAFCDISAMEVQLLNNDIPTFVFFSSVNNFIPKSDLMRQYYENIQIYNFDSNLKIDLDLQQKVKNYYISYQKGINGNMSYSERINWLALYTKKCQLSRTIQTPK